MGQGTHTSYLIPHTLGTVCTHTRTPHTTQIPYLTLPYLYKNIKHLTTAPSSSLDGTTLPTPTTPTVLGPSQHKPPYLPTSLPTHPPYLQRGERGVLYKVFYKSGRQQFSQLSFHYQPTSQLNLGVQYTLDKVDRHLSLNLPTLLLLDYIVLLPQ